MKLPWIALLTALLIGCASPAVQGGSQPKPAAETGNANGNQSQPYPSPRSPAIVATVSQKKPCVFYDKTQAPACEEHPFGHSTDFWVAAFTGILTVATGLLWWETRRTVNHARRASDRELRAYVFISDARFKWRKKKERWEAEYGYRNSGLTPAENVIVRSDLIVRDANDTSPMPEPKTVWPIGPIGPRDRFYDDAYFDDPAPNEGLKASLEDESKEVFLIGRIDYTDAFKKSRWTTFRYSVGGELGYDKHMSACKQGNATEESNPAST